MAETVHRGLTKLSFRRDVKLFFTILSGFFLALIALLLVLLQQVQNTAREATWRYWNLVADDAASHVESAVALHSGIDPGVLLTFLRGRYGISGAELTLLGQRPAKSGAAGVEGLETLARSGEWGKLTLYFDDTPMTSLRRTVLLTTIVTLTAGLAAMVLVLLYIPRITTPIEQLLDHASEVERRDPAVGEHEFLIETFRKSVATLKAQQEELHALHDAQKSRADDFERVTTALMRGLTSGLIAVGADGRIVQINDVAREILRIAEDAVGRDPSDALGGGEFAGVLREAAARRAPLTRVETRHTTPDGTQLVIGVTTVPLLNEADELLGMLALFTDLTSIRALEGRVREMQTLADLGEMSAGIAHEFRNSLSTILGYLKLAHRQQMPEDAAAKVRSAEEEAVQLSEAVASLLSFARPMSIHPQELDVRALIDSVLRRLGAAADGVRVTVEGEATMEGDPAVLSRAFENVLRNAVESVRARHRDGGGSVAVTIADGSVMVRDNGVGLDPETASRMFLPFQSDKPNGFGLGLALTRKIVLLHGGTISLTGMPGEGATVEMRF
ncbi:MAG TPA: ATP-binding protein [Thermoanaerobaculia bacterium]